MWNVMSELKEGSPEQKGLRKILRLLKRSGEMLYIPFGLQTLLHGSVSWPERVAAVVSKCSYQSLNLKRHHPSVIY